jgi:uncharacterized FAD-dependent dehydrogenase
VQFIFFEEISGIVNRKLKLITKGEDMKGTKSTQTKGKRTAEDWVSVARKFGEDCVAIQQDSKLDIAQKLKKQRELGNKMAKEIQDDAHLSAADKRQMVASINNYLDEWDSMYEPKMKGSSSETSAKKKK